MDKKIFGVYLAKLDAPDSESRARRTRLELPASPWELHDAMDKVQLHENEELYLEVDDYYDFEYLAPHLDSCLYSWLSFRRKNCLNSKIGIYLKTANISVVSQI